MKTEFSKKLLIIDYAIMLVLFLCTVLVQGVDFITLDVAWIAQLGIATGAYYWKARTENRVKVPIMIIETLPDDIRKELNVTEIITTIIQSN